MFSLCVKKHACDICLVYFSEQEQGSGEVPVGEDHGSHQGPDIEGQTQPAGGDLHPHCGPLAGYRVVRVWTAEREKNRFFLPLSS